MIDDNSFDRFHNDTVAHLIKSVWEKCLQGLGEVTWVEEWAFLGKPAFALPKGFMIGPENPPGKSAGVFHLWSNVEMWQGRHEASKDIWSPFVLDLETRFINHTFREGITRFSRGEADGVVTDRLAGRSDVHPCFRVGWPG